MVFLIFSNFFLFNGSDISQSGIFTFVDQHKIQWPNPKIVQLFRSGFFHQLVYKRTFISLSFHHLK